MRRTAPLIVGGGPAGCAAAIALAEAGVRPLLVERRAEPVDSVCGGFLSWDSLAALKALGVVAGSLGARPITRVRIVAHGRRIEARLPAAAAGLSRRALDQALLVRVGSLAEVRRGIVVRRVVGDTVEVADGGFLDGAPLIVATGKHVLRGAPREDAPPGSVGLRASVRATPDLDGVIELHPFCGGYAGLLVQEDGRANLCLSVSAARLRASGGAPAALFEALRDEAPALADRLVDPSAWVSVAGVPYGWRARASGDRRFRVGDQAAVIASVAGDGIGMALASGRAAAAAITRCEPASAWQRRFSARVARPIAIAEAARAIAERPAIGRVMLPLAAGLPASLGLLARLTRAG